MSDLTIRNATIIDGSGEPRYMGDVAVSAGTIESIAEPGTLSPGTQDIDAQGLWLTPGFVDIHTHYDGQVCWDKQVTPSAWHGVTTVVMGNCGVGFAPVRPGSEDDLVSLMESVEDIPGTALHEGIPWGWETFAEYLDVIDTPYAVDVGAQAPHVAIRQYVMGDRCYDDATTQDMEQMRDITRAALSAGALGFSTSRFYGHLDKAGKLIPGTHASAEEMMTIGDAFTDMQHGTIEIISDWLEDADELKWIEHIARTTGRPITTLTSAGQKGIWQLAQSLRDDGFTLRPQVGARPASILMTLEGTINPMRQHAAYREIQDLPLEARRTQLRDPAFRARVLNEEKLMPRNKDAVRMMNNYDTIWVMDAALSYEPSQTDSVAHIAQERGVDPLEVVMDTMADDIPLLVLFGRYPGDLEAQREMIENPLSVFGLSDGGAHCGVLVDASVPTYMLSYFTRDRQRGPKMSPEFVVRKMTSDTASVYGLNDRGLIKPGFKADLNLIDYDKLALENPRMAYDLPGGGKRLVQGAQGYRATICSGEVTYRDGEATGALPGRLIRGGS
ncbi:MAG: N-acyl-D-amino-acid deacylase [Limisphaerales bacterium]|jgi:N-acyl-D-amino-acid deacylase